MTEEEAKAEAAEATIRDIDDKGEQEVHCVFDAHPVRARYAALFA